MKRIAFSSRTIAGKLESAYEDSAKVITVKMCYDKEVNEFTRRNKEAHSKTANSRIVFR